MNRLFVAVLVASAVALILYARQGISLTVLWFVGPALPFLPFVAALAVDGLRDRLRFGLPRDPADDDDPVRLSPGARRFLRERGNRVWVWPGEQGLLAADLRPETTEQFAEIPLANGVQAYVARSVLASGAEPVQVRSEALAGLAADGWAPEPSALEVLVSPFARPVIRRNGNRVWIWMNDARLACAGFSPPTTREPYVRFDLGQGQEAYVSSDLEQQVRYLAVGFWPFPPWVSATVNNRQ